MFHCAGVQPHPRIATLSGKGLKTLRQVAVTAVVCSDKHLGNTLRNSFQSSMALLCGSLLAVLTIACMPEHPRHAGVVYTALFVISLVLLCAAHY